MAYSHELLISAETGEFDWTYIKRQAVVRAQREFGGCAPPVSYVRNEIRNLKGTAEIMRRRWRSAHGLPDDTVYEMVNVQTWGNSGDSFGRAQ